MSEESEAGIPVPKEDTREESKGSAGNSRLTRPFGVLAAALLFTLVAVYWNHFHNEYQFDDAHTIVSNPAIRDLRYLPRYFVDATTFSVNPSNQMYRPLLTATFALDYRLAGKLDPFYAHVQSFVWFLLLVGAMLVLFLHLLKRDGAERTTPFLALFAVAFFGLHPVSAETVNYIVQRDDLLSALAAVAGLTLFIMWPRGRRTGLYLLPVLLGCLCKQSTVMFGPILFVYVFLFETEERRRWQSRLARAFRRTQPALLLCIAYYVFQRVMTPHTFTSGAGDWWNYALTQPAVIFHYTLSFLFPLWLSADSDWQPVAGPGDPSVLPSIIFLAVFCFVIFKTAGRRDTRLIAFGLLWYLLSLVPTSSFLPWAEVLNDHRMFFPFVGLALALAQGLQWALKRSRVTVPRPALALAGVLVLLPYLGGTVVRNRIWHTGESLWYDVTLKSPRNGRGLMNYGLTQMSVGKYERALGYFDRAMEFTPRYSTLAINRGIALGMLKRPQEAEAEFKRALALSPDSPEPACFYARWLRQANRLPEANSLLTENVRRFPYHLDSAYLLIGVLEDQQNWADVERVAGAVLARFPSDATAQAAQQAIARVRETVTRREGEAKAHPDRDHLLDLSLAYFWIGRFADSLETAAKARDLDPQSAAAWNNIGASAAALKQWDLALQADQHAVALRPDWILAQNNLAFARGMIRNH